MYTHMQRCVDLNWVEHGQRLKRPRSSLLLKLHVRPVEGSSRKQKAFRKKLCILEYIEWMCTIMCSPHITSTLHRHKLDIHMFLVDKCLTYSI